MGYSTEYLHLDLGTSSEVKADLEYSTYHCSLVLSSSRLLVSFSRMVVLSNSHPLAFSDSCPLVLSSFSRRVVLSHSLPLVLFSSSRILVLSSSRPLGAFSWILEFSSLVSHSRSFVLSSSSRPLLVLSSSSPPLVYSSSRILVLAHSRPPLPFESKEGRGSTQEDLAYILGHWRTSRSVHTLGGELPLVLDCKVLC